MVTRERADVWISVGLGWGDLDNLVEDRRFTTDINQYSLSAGWHNYLFSDWGVDFNLKGNLSAIQIDINQAEGFRGNNVGTRRLRMLIEGERNIALSNPNAVVTPSFEAGLRYDTGDGETGVGVEFISSVSYNNPDVGLTVEARGRRVLAQDYEAWGARFLVRVASNPDGSGLFASLQPVIGQSESTTASLLELGSGSIGARSAQRLGGRLETELGYGFVMPRISGMFTPYAGFNLSDSGNHARVGTRADLADLFVLSVEAERTMSNSITVPDYGIILRGDLRF